MLDRLDVHCGLRVRERLTDRVLNPLGNIVRVLNAQLSGHEKVEVYESAGASLARSQRMERGSPLELSLDDRAKPSLIRLWQRAVQQSVDRFPQELDRRAHDVQGDQCRDDGVEFLYAGNPHDGKAGNDPQGRPYIGHEVTTVGREG